MESYSFLYMHNAMLDVSTVLVKTLSRPRRLPLPEWLDRDCTMVDYLG